MFGRKNKYYDLQLKYRDLFLLYERSEEDRTRYKDKYEQEKKINDKMLHPIDETCVGCKNCIVCDMKTYKEYFCKLNNHCKDYETE